MPKPRYVPERRNDRNSCGRIVARLRAEQKLTQQDLAGRLAAVDFDASEDVVRSIENGQREVTDIELKILAKALRVRADILLGL